MGNLHEPKWGRMESCGRLAIGLLELLLHRKAGRLTIGRRMPSRPTLSHADPPSIGECPSDLRRSETRLDAWRSEVTRILHNPAEYRSCRHGKSVETSLDAADTSVRATNAGSRFPHPSWVLQLHRGGPSNQWLDTDSVRKLDRHVRTVYAAIRPRSDQSVLRELP